MNKETLQNLNSQYANLIEELKNKDLGGNEVETCEIEIRRGSFVAPTSACELYYLDMEHNLIKLDFLDGSIEEETFNIYPIKNSLWLCRYGENLTTDQTILEISNASTYLSRFGIFESDGYMNIV